MDDIIQILFFVLTFALFVYSAIRKQKKQPTKQKGALDHALESFLGFPLTAEPLHEKAQYSESRFTEELDSKPQWVDKQKETKIEAPIKINEAFEEEAPIKPAFDLRSAIIYSEILNRKIY